MLGIRDVGTNVSVLIKTIKPTIRSHYHKLCAIAADDDVDMKRWS